MSSEILCDHCKKSGRRRSGAMAPDGWFFLEAVDDDLAEEVGNLDVATTVIYACSDACRDAQWKCGPGALDLSFDPRTYDPVADAALVRHAVGARVGRAAVVREMDVLRTRATRAEAHAKAWKAATREYRKQVSTVGRVLSHAIDELVGVRSDRDCYHHERDAARAQLAERDALAAKLATLRPYVEAVREADAALADPNRKRPDSALRFDIWLAMESLAAAAIKLVGET